MKLEERALFGLPIETPFGELKPLSIQDYMVCSLELSVITFDMKRSLHEMRLTLPEERRNSKEITEMLEKLLAEVSLKDFLISYMTPYFSAYIAILARCMFFNIEGDEKKYETARDFLVELSAEEFDNLRKVLMYINGQSGQTAFLDPELQRYKEKAIKFKAKDGEGEAPNVPTLVTSVVAFTGLTFDEIITWNITQLLQVFQRIQMLKGYDTTTLFATVAGDKVEVQEWSKNIVLEDDSNTSNSFALSFDKFEGDIGKKLGN